MKEWKDFDRFDEVCDRYLPIRGEGDTMATQAVTAICKLVYKWFNDGDVFDNTYRMRGWMNDLSSYANWLSSNLKVAKNILSKIEFCYIDDDYTNLLYGLCEDILNLECLETLDKLPKTGSIYDCDGPYKFEYFEDEDDDW